MKLMEAARELDTTATVTRLDVQQGKVDVATTGEPKGCRSRRHRPTPRVRRRQQLFVQQGDQSFIVNHQNPHGTDAHLIVTDAERDLHRNVAKE
jgi:hypothetical protein